MFIALASALLIAAQGPAAAAPAPASTIEQKEVAFEALAEGRADQAIATLRRQLETDPADPATLINLGSAYVARGDRGRAAEAYRAAIASNTRYSLELANGSWVDSRQAARIALRRLEQAQVASAVNP